MRSASARHGPHKSCVPSLTRQKATPRRHGSVAARRRGATRSVLFKTPRPAFAPPRAGAHMHAAQPPGSKRRGSGGAAAAAVERPASGAGLQAEKASSAGPGAPCGACKFLRRRCVPGCVFAPHFSGCGGSGVGAGVGGRGRERGAAEFAAVHRVFGASNVAKLLSRVPAALRRDATRTVCYEAQARLADPVYGSVGTILALQHQVSLLQGQLSVLESQLFNLRVALASAHPDTPPQHFVVLQPAHSAASTPNQVVVSYDDLPHAVDFMDAEP